MSKRKKRSTRKSGRKAAASSSGKKWFWLVAAMVLLALGVYQFFPDEGSQSNRKGYAHPQAGDYCKREPLFPANYGLQSPLLIDLSQRQGIGLFILEARQGGRSLHLPQWDFMGPLGPYALDEQGNIYLAPVPHVSLPPEALRHQNRIYRIDGQTGEASLFVELPAADLPSSRNPFGVMGLAYDCDSQTLYASSVAGSTPGEEKGRIYQIDVQSKELLDSLQDMDVLGLGIFNHRRGKRLYLGLARKPEVYVIELSDKGRFSGEPGFAFSLQQLSGGQYEQAHRIRFTRKPEMEIKAIEFNYTLMAASDPLRNIYLFDYNNKTDDWIFSDFHSQ